MYSVSKKARAISSCKEIICSLNFLGEERCLCILILFLEGTVTNYTVFIIGGCKRKNTNIIFYKNSRLLMNATQPVFKDNDDLFYRHLVKAILQFGPHKNQHCTDVS